MAVRAEPVLLERDVEREELAAALASAQEGSGRLMIIEGAAGIGKTRLLRTARELAEDAGLHVLAARATELEAEFPYGVVRQLFEPTLARADSERRTELLGGAARHAARVVGIELDDESAGAPAALADPSFATLNALYWLVSNLAEPQPMLLAIDDVHWADVASQRFLRFLAPRLKDLAVVLVCAARPVEPGTTAELLAALSADPAARVLRLRLLTPAAVTELVRSTLGADAHEDFCLACAEVTGGNPFLLRELLIELTAEGIAGVRDDARRVRTIAPPSVSRAVVARLARAPAPARALARAIAVLGDDPQPRHAAGLAGLERAEVAAAADALAVAGILEVERPLRFTHPLVRTAVYADTPAGERAAAHERAARMLIDDRAEPERVAVHLLAADPGGATDVAEILAAAARRALDRAAPEAALRYLRRALAESPPAALRRALVAQLVVAGFRASDPLDGIDPVAELADDAETLLRTAPALGIWLLGNGRAEDMEAVLERAARLAVEAGEVETAMQLEAQRAAWLQLPPHEACARLAPYADHVAPGSAAERLWLAMRGWALSFEPEGSAAEAAELAWRAVESGEIFADAASQLQAAQAILVLIRAERLDRADYVLDRLERDARARGAVPEIAGAMYVRGQASRMRGDIARAAAEARAAVDAARQGGFLFAFPPWRGLVIETLVDLDELDAAEAELTEAGLATGPMPDSYWFTSLRFARAWLRLAQGRTREAVDDLLAAARTIERLGIASRYYPLGACSAVGLAGLGGVEQARAALERALGPARAWGVPAPIAALLRARGVIEGGEEGLAFLREAVDMLEGSQAGLERMHALTDYGAALRRAGRRVEARGALRAALELARRGGARAVARRAAEELTATGERVRAPAATGLEALTPSERRVAALAAEGHSNAEIAQALFLTVKTVETHLTSAYRKLGIHSRRELPEVMGA